MINDLESAGLISFPTVLAARGNLTVLELPKVVPFSVKRIFVVHQVSNTEVRGEHAHKKCWQLLIATSGSIKIDLSDGDNVETFNLISPEMGLIIPPLIWGSQYDYSLNSSLLVLASEAYEEDDYLHDFGEFKKYRQNSKAIDLEMNK